MRKYIVVSYGTPTKYWNGAWWHVSPNRAKKYSSKEKAEAVASRLKATIEVVV